MALERRWCCWPSLWASGMKEISNEPIGNYTLRDSVCRVWSEVGVSYSSDLKKVREVLELARALYVQVASHLLVYRLSSNGM